MDLTAGSRFGTDSEFKVTLRPKQLVTQSSRVATLDYLKLESPSVPSAVALRASRNGYASGNGFWFDSKLADAILISTAPGHARAEYAAGVYPNVRRSLARAGADWRGG